MTLISDVQLDFFGTIPKKRIIIASPQNRTPHSCRICLKMAPNTWKKFHPQSNGRWWGCLGKPFNGGHSPGCHCLLCQEWIQLLVALMRSAAVWERSHHALYQSQQQVKCPSVPDFLFSFTDDEQSRQSSLRSTLSICTHSRPVRMLEPSMVDCPFHT